MTISGGTTFNEIFAKRVAVRARINEAIQADDEENLQSFVKAAQAGNISLSETREAVRAINGVLRDHGVPIKTTTKKKGKTRMATKTFATKQDVLKEVNKLAENLRSKDPKLTITAARNQVWKARPDLAQQYESLPEAPAPKKAGAVRKGQSTIDKVNAAAIEIRKGSPELTPAQARSRVWETHPDLVREYEQASRS